MELIKVSSMVLNGADVNSVNSRDIYEYLGLAKGQYSRWIKSAVEKYDFILGVDYLGLDMSVEGTIARTYFVTLDMAKELCMISDSKKGKETRKYFIECERKSQKPMTIQEQIALIAQGNQIIDDRVTLLEQTKRLEAWQERSLSDAKNKKVYSFNPSDGENTSKLHRAVWSKFKKHFNLPRYNELPAVKFEQGLEFINKLTLIDLV